MSQWITVGITIETVEVFSTAVEGIFFGGEGYDGSWGGGVGERVVRGLLVMMGLVGLWLLSFLLLDCLMDVVQIDG